MTKRVKADIKEHLPSQYYAYKEVDYYRAICRAEDPEFDRLTARSVRYLRNMAVTTADSEGLSRYEEILGITPGKDDDPEVRRIRILARINMIEPFDIVYLHRFLAGLVGPENYEIDMETLPTGLLHISIRTMDDRLFSVLYSELLGFIPCNLLITMTQIVEPEPAYLYGGGACSYGMTLDVLPRVSDALEDGTELNLAGAVQMGGRLDIFMEE